MFDKEIKNEIEKILNSPSGDRRRKMLEHAHKSLFDLCGCEICEKYEAMSDEWIKALIEK
jgi:hypothetical protein